MDKRISDTIQQVINEGTFTPDALKQFQEALEQAKAVEEKLTLVRGERDDYQAQCEDQRKEIMRLEAANEAIEERERAIHNREVECHKAEILNAAFEARAQTFSECFNKVFGNVQMHRRIHGDVPRTEGANQYVSTHRFSKDETISEDVG